MMLLNADAKRAEEAEQATRSARNDLSKEVVLQRIERGQEEKEAFFAEEEIRKMPKQFRKLFRTNKVNAHVRRKPNGVYEIRAQINGIKFAASGKLLEKAKECFIAKLSERVTERGTEKLNSRMLFAEYMAKWLETVRRPHVKEETYDGYMRTFRNNIEPNFGGKSIAEVSAFDLQDLISWYVDEGSIVIDGIDVTRLPEHKRAAYLGRVFQDPMTGTAASMQIEENLALAARRGKRRNLRVGITAKERDFYKEQLKILELGLENRLTTGVGLLSGGQRQALTLLMATLQKPKLLLLDEHTAALDPKTAAKVLEATDRIVGRDALTTIMITHNMKDAIAHGNRLVMMHEGQIIYDVSGEEKKRLTVADLLHKFEEVSGGEFANDRMILA